MSRFRGTIKNTDEGSLISGYFIVSYLHLLTLGLFALMTVPLAFDGQFWPLLAVLLFAGSINAIPFASGEMNYVQDFLEQAADE